MGPKTRNVTEVAYKVVAIGSCGVPTAKRFIGTNASGDPTIKAYGTYEDSEVYADPDVDVLYIGAFLCCIVLCEKPVSSNAAKLRSLLVAAKENDMIFMEAMWTPFQPLPLAVKSLLESGEFGARW
ncbi:D-xylose 1-dehydrogenase [Mycena kentingensis (nom. inval.)]|nr:D-xylose 1-dehydrogenase [Mycena kentingensis (nom. inval.)]